ncbi:MAG: phenylalanine--tRNA ligase subunit beta, partial [Pseudomonadota bacterium]
HEGIIDLPADAPVGADYAAWAGLDDPVIEIAITPNRGDCLGVRGIARDLAAAGLGSLKPLSIPKAASGFDAGMTVTLDFAPDAADACPLFVGRAFRGLTNGDSPRWLQDRLRAIGLRPISALVDVTNYVSIDLCRPLHAFDRAKLTGNVSVRLSAPDERITGLDEGDYALPADTVVIADAAGGAAIGGIMGGLATGVSDATTDAVLEVALFDPIRIAKSGRALGVLSDARRRFERGVDPAFAFDAAEIATAMILEFCGGEASEIFHAGAEPDWRRSYPLPADRTLAMTGVDLPIDRQRAILEALEFGVESDGAGGLTASPPPWRNDIVGTADLVEEVIRIHGYDAIPATPPARAGDGAPRPGRSAPQTRIGAARRALAARGLDEAVTFSFLQHDVAALFGGGGDALRLLNPISADLDCMRPSLLPNLLGAAQRNQDRGAPDVALFEIGPAFDGPRPEDERSLIGGLRAGRDGP